MRFFFALLFGLLLCSGVQAALVDGVDGVDPVVFLPIIHAPLSRVVIAAAHIDSAVSGEADEALLLWNTGYRVERLAGWRLTGGGRTATFPISSTLTLLPGERLWCANEAGAFRVSFGHDPGCEWGGDTDSAIPDLDGDLALGNSGGTVQVWRGDGTLADSLVYGNESSPAQGWIGLPAQAYDRGAIPASGQVWQRKRDAQTGWPVDTDRAADWAGDLADLAWGRQVRFPGWLGWTDGDLGRPITGTAWGNVGVAVGPEGLYGPISTALGAAQQSIDLSVYTFEQPALAEIVAEAARRGVRVRLLLEGGPAGGITDLERWCVARIVEAGVDVRYLAVQPEAPNGYRPRYRYMHAKYAIIDGDTDYVNALLGTDNFGVESLPLPSPDPALTHPQGRRGVYLFTNVGAIADGLARLFAEDWSPQRFLDLMPFTVGDATYGGPPPEFVFETTTEYTQNGSSFFQTIGADGPVRFVLSSAPENATRPDEGLMALIQRAGAGDEIRLEQLYEHKFWGEATSNPIADPNPRLEAIIGAARRGAVVRLMLDSYFDDPSSLRGNRATADYLHALAAAEGLDMQVRVGNPTGLGIHAKVVLVRVGGETWSGVGSLNGSEISHKINREVTLLVDTPVVYQRLLDVFNWDWAASPNP
ncbi:MAG: hypothetical protein KBG20_15330 [Caldilineaceae bacterium]|nr:hypothetical protein [Caldilineaceae bacterium]MBP8107487.1 hypothetical protein [Caldilineaceae bacterium]MBP8123774.1 hypothetical protein [Caldilineaceae bacterium]MBP9073678.1 hypothetical protein [Caldilineaceae bacterium]